MTYTITDTTYQLQDKIDVAHFLGMQFQDVNLPFDQWKDVRAYAKKGGLKI